MSDVTIHVPVEVRDRLVELATGEGLSLRDYLIRLAGGRRRPLTPAERARRAEQTLAIRRDWSGYDPTEAEQAQQDAELDRRVVQAFGD